MKVIVRLGAGLFLALVVAACDSTTEPPPPPPPPPTGNISGTVQVEGEPLTGVTLNLTGPQSASTLSQTDGSFAFQGVLEGQYTVSLSGLPAGVQFSQTSAAATVIANQTVTVAFAGTFVRTASITGAVLAGGTPVASATLTLTGAGAGTTTSDTNGAFAFTDLRAGTYTVTLSGFGPDVSFTVTARQVTLGVGDAAVVDFEGIRQIPASVSIAAFETARGFRISPNVLKDVITALVDLDQGTQTVTKVTLFLNGENVGEQVPPPAPVGGAQTAALVPQRLRFDVNTTEFNPATGGPRFPNGPATFRVVVDTQRQGAGATAVNLPVTLVNSDLIAGINLVGGPPTVVSGGKVWHGGGDLEFEIIPVIYDPNRTIGAIDVLAVGQSSANGGPSLDFGSGLGTVHRVTGPPFLFTASQALNDGFVEDDPVRGGHTISVVGVFDGNGLNITSDFLPGRATPLQGFYVDFVGPQMPPGTRLKRDGVTIAGGEWFSSGDFSLSIVTETGVGGITPQFDASVGGTVVASGIMSVDDLTERGLVYQLTLASVVDDLGNEGPKANVVPSGLFGVDRTPVTITGVRPTTTVILNPDDDGGDGITDNQIPFTATDPALADGSAGSGYGVVTALAVNSLGGIVDVSPQVAPNAAGANTLSPFILPEETYTVSIGITDKATPTNSASTSVSFVLDRTNPASNMGTPPPGSVLATAASLTFTISGSSTDANGVSSVVLTVRDADAGGAVGACEVTDPKVATTTTAEAGKVVQNTFDVTAEAGAFSRDVQVFKKGSNGVQQTLCFYIETADNATDVFGNLEPNTSQAFARTLIEWF